MQYDELRQHLLELDTAAVCDAAKILQSPLRVLAPEIRPLRSEQKLIGRAFTVRCHNEFLTVIKGLHEAAPGDVLVIDSQNSTKAVTGNLFPTEAMRKGLAGIINDGPCRDTAIVKQMDFPYYARSVTCVPGQSAALGQTQVNIECGGVSIEPGEVLFGDDDGIIAASRAQLAHLIPVAQQVVKKEARILEQMAAGTSLIDLTNFHEHCERLARGEASQLEFTV